jgi:hypothetical protein
MENSKLTSEDKVKIVSITLMAVDIAVMLVFTGMSVLVLGFSQFCRAGGGSIPLALSFLGSITPGKYFIFVSIVAVVLVLKERYVADKGVTLVFNVLVALFAMTYFLVCVVTIVVPLQDLTDVSKAVH